MKHERVCVKKDEGRMLLINDGSFVCSYWKEPKEVKAEMIRKWGDN
jgi:hypothetical protein